MSRLGIVDVGRLCGVQLPRAPGKAKCPIRSHHRADKTFRVFMSRSGDEVWKCWSCDEPDNVGDAVGLYAVLNKIPRKEAWVRLRDQGYDVPGLNAESRGRRDGAAAASKPAKAGVGVRGVRPQRVLALPADTLNAWKALPDHAVRAFLVARGFSEEFDFRSYGVIAMPRGCVGCVYVDPMSGVACRVKVRAMRDKVFWNEPRPDPEQQGAKALAPLFLADRLMLGDGALDGVVITEGEFDALALVSVGMKNVVSLPDGSESAATVSLEPLSGIFRIWYVAVDADGPGDKAWRVLRDRARAAGAEPVRVTWAKFDGEELQQFKDANDALRAGFALVDFERCLRVSAPAAARVA